MGNNSYKLQPKFMNYEIVEAMLNRIKTHCLENDLTDFLIIFHGGEPTLIGIKFYQNFIELVKKNIPESIKISYTMQSNGVLLTKKWCEDLKKLNISIGVSLDGTPNSNHKNRVYHNGKSSYKQVVRGFNLIKSVYGKEYASCLCVIDTNESPNDVYNHFKKLGINTVTLNFQDFNYIKSTQDTVPKIGAWLNSMFDIWYNDEDNNKPIIAPLEELIGLILGLEDRYSENFGKGVNETLVIETDGSIETVDTLKICGDGFTKTNFNVLNDELSLIFEKSQIAQLFYNSHDNLCDICSNCVLESVCGGGFLGHRFSDINEFDNPSIYCKEIVEIICHIQNKLLNELSPDMIKTSGIEPLNYREIINSINNQYVL
jgi:uncharacterized protein